jgi:hypothetical protein
MTIVNRVETAIALAGIAVFPVLGNAAALVAGLPRRVAQAALLLIFIGLLVNSARGSYRLSEIRQALSITRLRWVLAVAVGLVLLPVGIALGAGQRPAMYAVAAAVLTAAWLVLLLYHLTGPAQAVRLTAEMPGHPEFDRAIVVLLTGIALVAYLMGPDPGDAYMAFRGSTTQAGTCAAILAAIALAVLQGWQRFVSLLLSLYVSFIAASRTGVLLLLVLMVIVLVTRAANEKGATAGARAILRGVLLLGAGAAMVVGPAAWSLFYPYASSRPAPAGAHIEYKDRLLTDGEGLALRYKRLLRLVRAPILVADLPPSEIERLDEEGLAESRWVLVRKSLRTIVANPIGYWPRPFARQTQIYCGRPPICPYPHNVALEVGYHFGWVPFGVMILGLALLAVRAVFTLMQPDLLVRVSSIAFLGHLGFAQVSGNLLDHTLALGFGIVWTATRARVASAQGSLGR